MKTTTHFSICFILLSIFYTNSLRSAFAQQLPVLDISGNKLRVGVKYYILPFTRGSGGGLTLDRNKTCPFDVVQEPLEVERGLPVTFHPVTPNEGVVHVGVDQNFVFSASTHCIQSTVWRLGSDHSIERSIVTTGGVVGNPGMETLGNWIRIDRDEIVKGGYKLVYCPGVCSTCRVACSDLGILLQDGKRRLVWRTSNDLPFTVVFRKA